MQTPTTFKTISIIQGYFLLVGILLMLIASTFVSRSKEVPEQQDRAQIIKFSHQFHIKEAGIACSDCHEGASTSKLAADNLLSKKANCQSCHEEQLSNNCSYCHASDDKATYVAFQNPKRETVFNHELHVNDQKIACETCHQGLDQAALATEKNLPPMTTCTTCHNGVQSTNACETCHTNFAALRPKEHNRSDFVKEHRRLARMSDASCTTCHTEESCQDCHAKAGLQAQGIDGKDLVSPRTSRITANDRAQGMALTKVHDLNFRFTHSVAASAKTAECATCHSAQDFCSTCHAAGGNINQLQFRPLTHQQPRFVTVGVGTGGGAHADLARRDIESCAACHDAQGADPTCLTCHQDSDGIRGTDPKTHARGFMQSVEGEWHSDPGANCYVCHSDPNARVGGTKGQGFCRYCHQ